MPSANILIVEDNPTIAMDIRLNLEAGGYDIVGAAASGNSAIDILESKQVDIILLDINLNGEMTGIDLAHVIEEKYNIPFIYLTSYSDELTLEKAANTYPASYIVKPFKENDLIPAVTMALTKSKAKLKNELLHLDIINKKSVNNITKSEYNVMKGIWNAKNTQQIATDLNVSPNTTRTHIKNIYSKLQVHSKTELINYLRNLR